MRMRCVLICFTLILLNFIVIAHAGADDTAINTSISNISKINNTVSGVVNKANESNETNEINETDETKVITLQKDVFFPKEVVVIETNFNPEKAELLTPILSYNLDFEEIDGKFVAEYNLTKKIVLGEYTVVVDGLTKTFNGFKAVDSISFIVKKGEIFGLLGPNGAGKTTTIKMLVTLLKPSSGRAKVAGYDVVKQPNMVRKNIGIVFQEPTLDLELTAKENLDFHARLYGINREKRKERIDEVLKLVDLYDKANLQVKKFSGGMQRRLEIARGLLHFPKVLFLDEPTLGLDAQTRRKIWDYIIEMKKKEDVTIILTTHYIEEADKLCDRVAIIDKGKIIALDKPGNLKKRVGEDVISLIVDDAERLERELKLEEVHKIVKIENRLELSVIKGEAMIPKVVEVAQKAGVNVKAVSLREPTLEDVFIHLTGREIRNGNGINPFWMRR